MKRITFILLFLAALVGGFKLLYRPSRAFVISSKPAAPEVPAIVRALRPNYPYSVTPGGVYSRREFADWIQRDPLVRGHYQGLNIESLRLVTASEDRSFYVSFRSGDRIVWTNKKLNIPRGELLLTDGVNMVRARCGNRLTEKLPKDAAHDLRGAPPELEMPPFSMPLYQRGALPSFESPVATTPVPLAIPAAPVTPEVSGPAAGPGLPLFTALTPLPLPSELGPPGPVVSAGAPVPVPPCSDCLIQAGGPVDSPKPVPEPVWLSVAGLTLLLPGWVLRGWRRRPSK